MDRAPAVNGLSGSQRTADDPGSTPHAVAQVNEPNAAESTGWSGPVSNPGRQVVSLGKVVLGGGVGKIAELARLNLRNIPRP